MFLPDPPGGHMMAGRAGRRDGEDLSQGEARRRPAEGCLGCDWLCSAVLTPSHALGEAHQCLVL